MLDWPVILLVVLLCVPLISLPARFRAVGGIVAAACLLLAEPLRNAQGERLAGPCSGMAVVLFIAAGLEGVTRYRRWLTTGE